MRRWLCSSFFVIRRAVASTLTFVAFLTVIHIVGDQPAFAIPAFARKYGLPCSACHEAWPKLNSFGQTFKDNGYQLMNDRDAPIWQNPSYWPVAMRVTPHWHWEGSTNQSVDQGTNGVATVNATGFDLTGIDILTGGTLAKNISFLLVPSIDPGSGTISFESANVRLDNLKNSPWLNIKFGKFELDAPLSEKRIMTLSGNGGYYQLYHFAPQGGLNPNVSDFTIGENQLGIEWMGHSLDDRTRFAVAVMNSSNGALGLGNLDSGAPVGRSYDVYAHASHGFMAGSLGLQRVGAYVVYGMRPTFSLTSAGTPIAGTGRGNKPFNRIGVYGNLYIGKFDVTGVYQRATDDAYLANGLAADGTALAPGLQNAVWNTGTFEAHYTYSPRLFFLGRYELVRMSQQAQATNVSDFGNVDVFTVGYRYYPFIHSRAGFAWHQEFSTLRSKGTGADSSGAPLDQRFNSLFMGFDFAF